MHLTGPAAQAAACDAMLTPVVTGQIDHAALDHLTSRWLTLHTHDHTPAGRDGQATGDDNQATGGGPRDGEAPSDSQNPAGSQAPGDAGGQASPRGPLPAETRARLQATLLQACIDVVSGPGGLASYLRGALLNAPFTTLSQPLDIGRSTRTIPPHLRTAVTLRDKHCQFPGCRQPSSVCDVHHLIHWAHGGPTSLGNLGLYCRFHHLIVIHRWGWNITRHPDGTTTATAPDGQHPPQPQPTPASRLTSGATPSRDPVRHDATGNRPAFRAWEREPGTTEADGRTLDAIVSWTC